MGAMVRMALLRRPYYKSYSHQNKLSLPFCLLSAAEGRVPPKGNDVLVKVSASLARMDLVAHSWKHSPPHAACSLAAGEGWEGGVARFLSAGLLLELPLPTAASRGRPGC